MIAIHAHKGTFSDRWIEFCEKGGVDYKIVDCYKDNILSQLENCTHLLWHWPHHDMKGSLVAKQITFLCEQIGVKVFPSFRTAWHYDDKIAQKYIFEAYDIPHIPTRIFFTQDAAEKFANAAEYPQVFKLSRGAGSMNVQLIRNRREAARVIRRSFSRGWDDRTQARRHALQNRLSKFRRDRNLGSFFRIALGLARYLFPKQDRLESRVEKGYTYFQDFVPNNDHDIRVIVIGEKAFAIKRLVRSGDFRASGSGSIGYDASEIPISCVRLAFETNGKLGANCLAYDFVFMEDGAPRVVEISYAFSQNSYLDCPGYWDQDLVWHEAKCVPERMMLEAFLN